MPLKPPELKLRDKECELETRDHAIDEMIDDHINIDDVENIVINGNKTKNHRNSGWKYRLGLFEVIADWIKCHCIVITAYNWKDGNRTSTEDKPHRIERYMRKNQDWTCPRCYKAELELGDHPFEVSDKVIGEYRGLKCPNCQLVCFDKTSSKLIMENLKNNKMHPLNSHELCLLLLYATDKPIQGATVFMKEVFLLVKEKLRCFDVPVVSPHFISYHYGPYSFDIDEAWNTLDELGLIQIQGKKSSKRESFHLTESGEERAKRIFDSLPMELKESLYDWRRGLDELGRDGILKAVYKDYESYTDKSKIKDKVLPSWTHPRA